MNDATYESILLDAFDQLEPYFTEEKTKENKLSVSASLQATIKVIRGQLSGKFENAQKQKEVRLLPPQLSGSNLAKMLGAIDACWIIEDFHKVDEKYKVQFSQLMKVFMDQSEEHKRVKIIAVGAVNSARQVIQYDHEMTHRVAEIKVPLMSREEIETLVHNGADLLKVIIEQDVIDEIVKYSKGVAAIAHELCYAMCDIEGVDEAIHYPDAFDIDESFDFTHLTMSTFNQAVLSYLDDQSDTLKSAFDKSFRVEGADCILYALSHAKEEGLSPRSIEKIVQKENLQLCIEKDQLEDACTKLLLEEYGGVLRHDEDSNKYYYRDPFYHTFASMYFKQSENQPEQVSLSDDERRAMLNDVFSIMTDLFQSSHSFEPQSSSTSSKTVTEKEYTLKNLDMKTEKLKRSDESVSKGIKEAIKEGILPKE